MAEPKIQPQVDDGDWVDVPETYQTADQPAQVEEFDWVDVPPTSVTTVDKTITPRLTQDTKSVFIPEKNITVGYPLDMSDEEAAKRIKEKFINTPINVPSYFATEVKDKEGVPPPVGGPSGLRGSEGKEPLPSVGGEPGGIEEMAKQLVYWPTRLLSEGIEKPAWAVTRLALESANGYWKLGRVIAEDLNLVQDQDWQKPGFLDRAVDYYSRPEDHGLLTPWAEGVRASRDQANFQRNYLLGLAGRMAETSLDLTAFFMPFVLEEKLLAAVPRAKAPEITQTIDHAIKMAKYGYLTTNGNFTERTQAALTLTAYGVTAPIANATGATGLNAMAVNALLNIFLNSPTYKQAFDIASGFSKEFYAMMIPQFMMDVAFSWNTRGTEANLRKLKTKNFIKNRAKEMNISEAEYLKMVEDMQKVLTNPASHVPEPPEHQAEVLETAKAVYIKAPEPGRTAREKIRIDMKDKKGNLLGALDAEVVGDVLTLNFVEVAKGKKRKGIATKLYNSMIAKARETNPTTSMVMGAAKSSSGVEFVNSKGATFTDPNTGEVISKSAAKDLTVEGENVPFVIELPKTAQQKKIERLKALQANVEGTQGQQLVPSTPSAPSVRERVMPQVTPLVTDPKAGGETKTRGLSVGVAEKALEEGLVKKMSGLPEYETVNLGESARKAAEFVTSDPARALRVAMGEELAPPGVIPELVFDAVERKALAERDLNVITDLATKSGLLEEATTMGQRLSALQMRDETSPTKAVREVQKERTKTVKEKLKTKTVEKAVKEEASKIEKEVKKNTPSEKEWGDFLDIIVC